MNPVLSAFILQLIQMAITTSEPLIAQLIMELLGGLIKSPLAKLMIAPPKA